MKELLLYVFLPQLSINFWHEVPALIKHSADTKTSFFKELRSTFNYAMSDYKDHKFITIITITFVFGIFVPLTSLSAALQIYYTNRYIDNFSELYIQGDLCGT